MSDDAKLDRIPDGAKPELKPDPSGPPPERLDKQSRSGVASFVLSTVAAAAVVHTALRFNGLKVTTGTDAGSIPNAAIWVTVVFGGALVLQVVALVLGFMGTFQRTRRRTLGAAGIALSAVMLASVLAVAF